MTKFKIVSLMFILVLNACGSLGKKTAALSVGDSKEQVLSHMGAPEDRQMSGDKEAWGYSEIASFGVCKYHTIWLVQGRVAGINSYSHGAVGGCSGGFREVRWEDAPNSIIEIRNR